MLKANDIWKKSRIACNTGVIHVIEIFSCRVLHLLLLLLPVDEQYLNNRNSNKHENFHILFLACALSGYIFVNPFTSCVTDRYQYKQCIMMETETETNMKICMY